MAYPVLSTKAKKAASTTVVTDVFQGYNHNIQIKDSEMFETKNLTADYYPLLASRQPRAVKGDPLTLPGGLLEKDSLCYVDNGKLFVNHLQVWDGLSTATGETEKTLISMGAYILIFPDKKYYNTANGNDKGDIEATHTLSSQSVSYAPCSVDGEVYTISSTGSTEPDNPQNGDYWINTADNTLQQFSAATGMWDAVATVYTKVTFTGSQGYVPAKFKEGDAVDISGLYYDELNGTKYIYALGGASGTTDDYIVLIGLFQTKTETATSVKIERKLPDMDYIVECQNRLWGCKYGFVNGETINEVYCSALGDFKNWRVYQGLSTDSWAASIGSDGQWTGAVNYLGHPVFFKENRIHVVTVSSSGGHRVEETICRGVQKGSHKSLRVVGETLYYKSRTDVCAWQGGFPTGVSDALGGERYYNAVAGAFGKKYWISMQDSSNNWQLFTYDISKGIWLHVDDLHVTDFAAVDDELWCIDSDKRLIALNGTDGTKETSIDWMVESGILHYTYPNRKYVSRYDVSLSMERGAKVKVYLQYNSTGPYELYSQIQQTGTGSVTLPIRPRRCDHLRMRLVGNGDVKIFSISRKLEVSSDV